jgi:hypothetical protein
MSEYELISLFNEFFNTAFARLNDFLLGLFAMLVAGYFAAARLSRAMVVVVAVLYTLFALATIVPALAATYRFVLTAEQIRTVATTPGSGLGALVGILPSSGFVMPTMTALLLIAYAGAMVFFFQARKNDFIST